MCWIFGGFNWCLWGSTPILWSYCIWVLIYGEVYFCLYCVFQCYLYCSLHYCTGILWGKTEESFSIAVGHGSVPGLLWCCWLAPRAFRGELLCLCACWRVCLEDPAVWFNAEQMAYLPLDVSSYWSVSFPQFASWKRRIKQRCLRSNCASILNALQSMVREVRQGI